MGPLTTATEHAGVERAVGVVFDDDHLWGVEVSIPRLRGRNRRRIERTAWVELPYGVVADRAVADHEAFVAALQGLWEKGGFRTRRVALGLDAGLAVIRRAELPVLAPDELAQAAAYEIGDLLRYPLDQALVSTVELDRGSTGGVETAPVLTLAVHEATIVRLAAVARDAGLQPVATELVLTALVAAAESTPSDPGGVRAIVHVTSLATDVIVHDAGGILFGRVIAAGVDVAETPLSDQLALELALLDGFTSDRGGEPTSGQVEEPTAAPDATAPGIATVVEGVRRTLQYYLTEVDGRPLERLALCGPQSGVAGLANALGECFPAAEVVRDDAVATLDDIEQGPPFDAAYSVAVAATGGGRDLRRFDLVPAAVRTRRAGRRRLGIGVAVAAVLFPLLAADAVARRGDLAGQQEQLETAERITASLQSELAEYDDDRARQIEADRATDRVNQLYTQEYGFTTLVRQVAESMPDDTFLISIRMNRPNPGELPTGYSGPDPSAIVSFSGVAGDLDGVGRWMQNVDQDSAIDGLWLTQTAFAPYNDTDQVAAVFTVDGAVTGAIGPVRTLDGDR